jgi:hypothetical protein
LASALRREMKLFFYFGLIAVGFAVATMVRPPCIICLLVNRSCLNFKQQEAQRTVMPSLTIESLSAVTHEMDETVKSGELPIFKGRYYLFLNVLFIIKRLLTYHTSLTISFDCFVQSVVKQKQRPPVESFSR